MERLKTPKMTTEQAAVFWSKVDMRPDGNQCWPWGGSHTKDGYAQHCVDGTRHYVHRLAYTDEFGDIPDGHEVDHVKARGCTRRDCCNPAHLEAVDRYTNQMRSNSPAALNARKLRCKNGHPFTVENTYLAPDGSRKCRTCMRAANRAGYARRRAAAQELREAA